MLNLSGTNTSLCGASIPDLPHYASYSATTVTSAGTLIECGGSTPGTGYSQLCYYLGDDNEWHLAPVLPIGSYYAAMVSLDNYVVYFGGVSSSSGSYRTNIYSIEDTLNGSWSYVDDMLSKRYLHCAVTIDTGVIIIGQPTYVAISIYLVFLA